MIRWVINSNAGGGGGWYLTRDYQWQRHLDDGVLFYATEEEAVSFRVRHMDGPGGSANRYIRIMAVAVPKTTADRIMTELADAH